MKKEYDLNKLRKRPGKVRSDRGAAKILIDPKSANLRKLLTRAQTG
jgi:hypothetical protein